MYSPKYIHNNNISWIRIKYLSCIFYGRQKNIKTIKQRIQTVGQVHHNIQPSNVLSLITITHYKIKMHQITYTLSSLMTNLSQPTLFIEKIQLQIEHDLVKVVLMTWCTGNQLNVRSRSPWEHTVSGTVFITNLCHVQSEYTCECCTVVVVGNLFTQSSPIQLIDHKE